LQYCPSGTQDDDCDQSTPCIDCDNGEYSPGGESVRRYDGIVVTQCVACDAGKHAPEGSRVSDCVECEAGSADLDLNAWTPCAVCGEGTIPAIVDPVTMMLAFGEFGYLPQSPNAATTNATKCHECAPGRHYGEMPNGGLTCYDCPAGKFNPIAGSFNSSDCTRCPAGAWSINGSAQCSPCQVGNFRPDDVDRCQPCLDESWRCDEEGLAAPKAAPGYFQIQDEDMAFEIEVCSPFEACIGTCCTLEEHRTGATVCASVDSDQPGYADATICPGGRSQESCSPGYTGERCSSCKAYDSGVACAETGVPNGFYRMSSRCLPCPCSWFTTGKILAIGFVVLVLMMTMLDHLLKGTGHISTIFAPVAIIVTFVQTLALLLDLDTPWPPGLKAWMQAFSILNVNLVRRVPARYCVLRAAARLWICWLASWLASWLLSPA
jgi:hypothetical protein